MAQKEKNTIASRIIHAHTPTSLCTDNDASAIRELADKVDGEALKEYILSTREKEARKAEKQAEEKKHNRPFEQISTPELKVIQSHWHTEVARCVSEELARRELIYFTKHTNPRYVANWHHEEYAKKLDAFIRGEIKKMMVFMPAQHGKSELCSRRMPAKMHGLNPNRKIALVSYNHKFASKFNREIQRIIDSDVFRSLFPCTTLSDPKQRITEGAYVRNADEFEIVNHDGSLVSVGVDGGLTGRPVDVLIIDDPYKGQKQAWSPKIRRSVQEWYDTVADMRLHNDSQQLLTLTRWHEDDLAGYILKTQPGEWVVVIFPGIKEGEPLPHDPRRPGEALWPEVHSLKKLESIKKRNNFVYQAMVQQNPKPAEGLLFPPDSLNWYEQEDIADVKFDTIVAVSDVADTGTDYYCMLIAGVLGEKIYILDVIFTVEPVKVTIPLTIGKLTEWRPAKHRIESNNGGSIYAHSIREKKTTATTIEEKVTSTNKETRILMASGQIQEYCWFREDYAQGSQYEEYINALTSYLLAGGNEHDDAPDATTMLIDLVHPMATTVTIKLLGAGEDSAEEPERPSFFQKIFNRLSESRSDKWY